jgi:hypothetical protein
MMFLLVPGVCKFILRFHMGMVLLLMVKFGGHVRINGRGEENAIAFLNLRIVQQ